MAVIDIDGLTKDYGEVLANDDLTFTVEAGEIFGYLGPNGAGKTTTIRMLLGFMRPTSGTATVLGTDIYDRREMVQLKRHVGYLSDTPGFDESATGREIVDLHAAIKGDERSGELLELFDPPMGRQVRDYSRGNKQKLGLVTTFMHDPDLVVLDEPTNGLDPLMKQRFSDFLRAERDRGLTVLLSSHILSEVRRLCDRVGIIRNGRLVTVDPIETLLERSGKVVRIDSAEPIPLSVLDFSGVHDLEIAGRDETGESAADPAVEGEAVGETDATDASVAEVETAAETFTECAFTYTGDINELVARLPEEDLRDLSIEEAPLEDVFLRFYGGEADA